MVQLSAGQERALDRMGRWVRELPKQVFVLDGPAGSGKTTIVKRVIENVDGLVLCAAPTGKAALRMKQLGYPKPQTLHKLLFNPKDRSQERVRELEMQLRELEAATPPTPQAKLERASKELNAARRKAASPLFEGKEESDLAHAKLLIVDEGFMVDKQVGLEAIGYKTPILVMGDSAQLPPIGGPAFFARRAPDQLLTEVHRQARDNPVLRLATDARERRLPAYGVYGDSKVVDKLSMQEAMQHDQILVGRNHTRRAKNKGIREILGRKTWVPEVGDRVICRKNQHSLGLINGSMWRVLEVGQVIDEEVPMLLKSDDGYEDTEIYVRMHAHPFRGEDVPSEVLRMSSLGDHGYVITTHLAQGSEWNSVMVNVEPVHNCDYFRWLYTAISRARLRVTIKLR